MSRQNADLMSLDFVIDHLSIRKII